MLQYDASKAQTLDQARFQQNVAMPIVFYFGSGNRPIDQKILWNTFYTLESLDPFFRLQESIIALLGLDMMDDVQKMMLSDYVAELRSL